MSKREILTELPNLTRSELEQVDARLHELLGHTVGTSAKSQGEALLEIAGTAQGLPEDYAHNHDHYLHGATKRSKGMAANCTHSALIKNGRSPIAPPLLP